MTSPIPPKGNKMYTALLSVSMAASCVTPLVQAQEGVLEEIVVTGSFIKGKQQSDSMSPITVVGAEKMEQIGAFAPVDIVNSLTANAGAQNNNDGFNQSFSLGTTNVNLRGLGVSSTLTLLNGRRQTTTAATTLNGDQFTDLNSLLPSIAIDRAEVLKDGASSLYGSDAVAGVVNFMTRGDFEGVELGVDHKSTTSDSQDDTQFSGIVGKKFGAAHVIAALSYFDRSSLSAGDRRDDFPERNANSIFGAPGTFLVFRAGPPLLMADPSCASVAQSNPETTPGIAPTGHCLFDFGDYFSLVAEEERIQSYAEINVDVSESTEFFAEVGYTTNEIVSTGSPSQPILFPPFIPPFNPAFDDPALAAIDGSSGALLFARVKGTGSPASEIDIDSDTWRVAGGFRGDFNEAWSWQAAISASENTYDYSNTSDTLVDRFNAALFGRGGPNNDLFYNPIYGADNDPAVLADFRGAYAFEATSSLVTVDAHVSAELFELSAGTVGLAAGVQYRYSELEYDYSDAAEQDNLYFFRGNRSFGEDEDVYAIFVEIEVPVSEELSLTFALRYEDFGDFDTVDPKIGFMWANEQLSLRGTYGTSFRAPSIFQTSGGLTVPARIFDPVVGGLATISQRTEGDPDDPLVPQESDTYNLGVTWVADEPSLTASLDYWRFEYDAFITPENATAVVAVDPFGRQVERDPTTGTLLAVTTFFRNAGKLETDGLDLSIDKGFSSDMGEFKLTLDATYILTYDLDDPVRGDIDGKGLRNFTNFGVPMPGWRAALGLLWDRNQHSANVFVRYIDSYEDDNVATPLVDSSSIESWTTVDVQYSYDFGDLMDGDSSLVLILGAKNLFDEMAPDVVTRSGYDPLTHNPLGQQVYFMLKAGF